jgi:hypothetical protein
LGSGTNVMSCATYELSGKTGPLLYIYIFPHDLVEPYAQCSSQFPRKYICKVCMYLIL